VGSGGHAGGVDRLHPAMCSHMWETRAKPEPGRGIPAWIELGGPRRNAATSYRPDRPHRRRANQIDIRLRPRRLSALLGIATSAFTCRLGPRLNWERASTPTMIEEIRFEQTLRWSKPDSNSRSRRNRNACSEAYRVCFKVRARLGMTGAGNGHSSRPRAARTASASTHPRFRLTGQQLDHVLSFALRHLSRRRREGLDQTVACRP
jgi:hypothetical protein